jgi:ABC-type branched-subunit amino acid transport system substrate-binding protein
MEPLRGADPSRIGGYRPLRRLGAGGMGVVYLARSATGALAAVKVIRAAHADDTGFRARFRREVETASRVASPWVVPLLDADPDAESPWLATEFVPGPALTEAVDLHGPLPYGAARLLGARLAEALGAVHGAGLVHRDIKPGNVLLALDGPRLIDFGIARAPDDTALTATGTVVGSPGFLSPEQAQGRGREIGPPSDVFSLGCLLAFAVTGTRPFGVGSPAGVLMRTVHDEPDLDGTPPDLLPLLRACLAKDRGARPTTAELRQSLDGLPGHTGDGEGGPWLPEPLTRLIARRSAAVLALPAVQATEVSTPSGTGADPEPTTQVGGLAEPGKGSSRRRFLVLGSSAAGVLAAGGGVAWWAGNRSGTTPARGPGTSRPRLAVAFQADLSGDDKADGRAQENAVRLAFDRLNARSGRTFDLVLRVHDDEGDPDKALRIARELAADDGIRAVVGPTTDVCAAAVLGTYAEALLAMVCVSVGIASDKRAYVLAAAPESYLAAPIVAVLSRTVRSRRTVLVDDAAEGNFSWQVCTQIDEATASAGHTVVRRTLAEDAGSARFRELAEEAAGSKADAVVFGGGPERAARLARALRTAGYTGARLATERAMDTAFLTGAGEAAEGWEFATRFLDPARVASARAFTAAYRARYDGADPPRYAAEAYDAAFFLARAMAATGEPDAERGAIVRRLRETDYRGITKRLRVTAPATNFSMDGLYLYRATGDGFRYLGQYEDVTT